MANVRSRLNSWSISLLVARVTWIAATAAAAAAAAAAATGVAHLNIAWNSWLHVFSNVLSSFPPSTQIFSNTKPANVAFHALVLFPSFSEIRYRKIINEVRKSTTKLVKIFFFGPPRRQIRLSLGYEDRCHARKPCYDAQEEKERTNKGQSEREKFLLYGSGNKVRAGSRWLRVPLELVTAGVSPSRLSFKLDFSTKRCLARQGRPCLFADSQWTVERSYFHNSRIIETTAEELR